MRIDEQHSARSTGVWPGGRPDRNALRIRWLALGGEQVTALIVPHPCQNKRAQTVMGGHSRDIHMGGGLDLGRYQCRPNKPDKEEVIGQAGEKDVLFLKQLIEAGKYREVIDRSYPRLCRNLCVRPSPCIPGNSCRGGNHYDREECISQSRRSNK